MRIVPSSGQNTALTFVTISGANFRTGATARLESSAEQYPLRDITVSDSTTIRAEVPVDVRAGQYDVDVTNADGTSGRLTRGFTVTGIPAVPQTIRPPQGSNDIPTDVVIEGFNFREGVSVAFELDGVSTPLTRVERRSSTQIRAVVPTRLTPGVYDLVLRNAGSSEPGKLTGSFTVLSTANDDFFVGEDDIWTNPVTVRTGGMVQLGVNLHRRGGKATLTVPVVFYLGDPAAGGTLIAQTTSVPIGPRTETESVFVSWAAGSQTGAAAIYVVVDPNNTLTEATRANNRTSRVLTILPAAADTTPPEITGLSVNNDAGQTSSAAITVTLAAGDPRPGTGVAGLYLVEREFNSAARSWVAVQNTGWVTYTSPYALALTEKAGIRYIQAWVADGAGNASLQAVKRRIDYIPPSDSLLQNQVRLYRRTLSAGESLTARVVPSSGDADLYVWDPDGNSVLVKNASGTVVDEGTITASKAGVYQIEVYAYTDVTYQLTLTGGSSGSSSALGASAVTAGQEKTARTSPSVSVSNEPEGTTAVPAPPIVITGTTPTTTGGRTYLPAVLSAYAGGW